MQPQRLRASSGEEEPPGDSQPKLPFPRNPHEHFSRNGSFKPRPNSPRTASPSSPSEQRVLSPGRFSSSVSQRLRNSPSGSEAACTCDAALELEEMRSFTDRVTALNSVLLTNISSLYKTAREEIKRKDQMLAEKDKQISDLTAELETLRRRLSEYTRSSYRSQSHRGRGDS